MTIRSASYEEVLSLKGKDAPFCGFIYHPDTQYIGAFEDGKIIGCVGYRVIGKRIELLSAVVRKTHRGNGVYTKLAYIRRKVIDTIPHQKEFAYCTAFTLDKYLKDGFVIKKKYNNTTKVEREV